MLLTDFPPTRPTDGNPILILGPSTIKGHIAVLQVTELAILVRKVHRAIALVPQPGFRWIHLQQYYHAAKNQTHFQVLNQTWNIFLRFSAVNYGKVFYVLFVFGVIFHVFKNIFDHKKCLSMV